MTAPQLLTSSPFSGSHPAEPQLKWMVVLSGVVHLVAFGAIMGLPPSSSRNIFYSPTYSVDLVGLPAGGAPFAGSAGKTSGTSAAGEVKKQHVKLWKGPAAIESQVKVQAGRSHPAAARECLDRFRVIRFPFRGCPPSTHRAHNQSKSPSRFR